MSRTRPVAALAAALILACPADLPADIDHRPAILSDWRDAESIPALVSVLDDWLDAQSIWPRRATAPRIRLVTPWQAAARQGETASFQRGSLRGAYDPDRSEILLVRPWSADKPQDVSVLLHELVHHRQAPHHWYCPAAQELPAYRLQEDWLEANGRAADVNWVAVVLDAGCTPRDIHPD
ncbi:DUF6647 family protein [Cribrihabitans sp. XS_ASV171]